MHMADALVSPAVAAVMLSVSGGAVAYSAAQLRTEPDEPVVPLMGVLGAFLFAAQMINFSIPGTGSSGHLGGGLLAAILLGPYAALLVVTSVLVVQALFFADGGLLALGCNIFNLAVVPAFLVYPLVYLRLLGKNPGATRLGTVVIFSAMVSLQLGALGVVLETVLSGVTAIPFQAFVLVMQPIHLAIGVVEGIATAAIIVFFLKARPDQSQVLLPTNGRPLRATIVAMMLVALLVGGVLSRYASTSPDGLEWSLSRAAGGTELSATPGRIHALLAAWQEQTALFPDYLFKPSDDQQGQAVGTGAATKADRSDRAMISVAGVAGGVLTLVFVVLCGVLVKWYAVRRTDTHHSSCR